VTNLTVREYRLYLDGRPTEHEALIDELILNSEVLENHVDNLLRRADY
jgi:hypothetical protein